jgi:hypothetical protein
MAHAIRKERLHLAKQATKNPGSGRKRGGRIDGKETAIDAITTGNLSPPHNTACLLSPSTMDGNPPENTKQKQSFLTRLKNRAIHRSKSSSIRPASPPPPAFSNEPASVPQAIVPPVSSLIHPDIRPLSSTDHTSTSAHGAVAHASAQPDNRPPALERGELLSR